jgi:hypothetical protein
MYLMKKTLSPFDFKFSFIPHRASYGGFWFGLWEGYGRVIEPSFAMASVCIAFCLVAGTPFACSYLVLILGINSFVILM